MGRLEEMGVGWGGWRRWGWVEEVGGDGGGLGRLEEMGVG